MKRFIILFTLLAACGGPQFQAQDLIAEDAGSDSNSPVSDTKIIPPPDGNRAPETGDFKSDAGPDTITVDADAGQDSTPDTNDSRDDSWPADVILVPYCQTSELYPAYSQTCYDWGATHGWTVQACCLPDHSCGTVTLAGKCQQ